LLRTGFKGKMRVSLTGKTIVAGGGTGEVGVGIVSALVERGARVIVPSRNPEKGKRLRETAANPDLVEIIKAAPTDEAGASQLAAALGAIGRIDGAIASLGSWFAFGRLVDTPANGFETAYRSLLFSHFLFAKTAVPLLSQGGTYAVINGAGSESPVPNSSATSIHAHGLSMLFETLVAEHSDLHLHMLMLRSIIATPSRGTPDPSWVTNREVGDITAWLFTPEGRLTAGSIIGLQQKRMSS
jgi:NAD(P)-dependent dehydrogenase (short-subunit alcohol dehydrogenase family)